MSPGLGVSRERFRRFLDGLRPSQDLEGPRLHVVSGSPPSGRFQDLIQWVLGKGAFLRKPPIGRSSLEGPVPFQVPRKRS